MSPAFKRRRIRSKSDDVDDEDTVVERGWPFAERLGGMGAVRPSARTALRVAKIDVPM